MKFDYTYRSSDGQRHTAQIEAENRDAAFARVRGELGIKPIKVTAADASQAKAQPSLGGRLRTVAILSAAALAVLLGVWLWVRRAESEGTYLAMTPHGPVTYMVASPLPRQTIPGDRQRIEAAKNWQGNTQDDASGREADSDRRNANAVFGNSAERWLARFAEPGRAAEDHTQTVGHQRPSAADFDACFKNPIRIASSDFTEIVDLKRIVTGMKREMRAYLSGGGTVDGYLGELEKRQRLEISYRERAEQKLAGLLKDPKSAYAYWLKANASLKSMGIYELPLPDELRSYQTGLDIDE